MKLNQNASEILERYMLGVRRSLTGQKREDISKEIESHILDTLEERFPDKEEVGEVELKAVLGELGSPVKITAQFSPQRYLIGPQFFHIYLWVLRIVVPVVAGALLLSIVIGALAGQRAASGFPFVEYLGTLWNGAFMAAAFVTLVFAIIERVNSGKDIQELRELEQFKLEDLPELKKEEKSPDTAGMIIEIILGVVGLAFFTYVLNNNGQFPVYVNPSEKMGQVQVFTEGFLRFVPAMMAIAGVEIARNVTLLVQNRHSSLTNWWHMLTEGAHITLSALLLGAFPLVSLEWLRDFAMSTGWDFAAINNSVHIGLKVILVLSIVGSSVEIIRRLVREIANPAR